MKRLLLLLAIPLLFLSSLKAQTLQAHAGPDRTVCSYTYTMLGDVPAATGGVPPYTYLWTPTASAIFYTAANTDALVTDSTVFNLHVTDANGDTANDMVIITVYPQVFADAGASSLVCYDACAQLGGLPAAAGGTPPYNYLWSPSAGVNSSTDENTQACLPTARTVYQLEVTDFNGCKGYDTAVVEVAAHCGSVWAIKEDATCGCNGSIRLLPQQPGNYTYVWDNGDTSSTADYLCAGQYDITVFDNGLPVDTVHAGIALSGSTLFVNGNVVDVTCFGATDGWINAVATGGTAPYSYFWSNFTTTPSINNLNAGVYQVVVTDATGCDASATFTVSEPALFTVSATAGNATACNGPCDGFIDVTATGGTAPYSYTWSNGMATEDAAGMCPGQYNLTVTSSSGCEATVSAFISCDTACHMVLAVSSTGISCLHSDTTTLIITNGTPPYTVNWNDGISTIHHNSIATHHYAQGGIYNIVVSDTTFCAKSILDTLVSTFVTINTQQVWSVSCGAPNSGKIKIAAGGGTPPYTYIWSNGGTADSIANLVMGNYSVTVSDATSCTAARSFSINQVGLNAYGTSTAAGCAGGNAGTATIHVSGGNSPYTYVWNTNPVQTGVTATGLGIGHYTFTVTDAGGCTQTGGTYVNNSYSSYAFVQTTAANCANNGQAIAFMAGGTAPYTYQWNTTPIQTTQTATGLGAGYYTVTITDAGGCRETGTSYVNTSCNAVITGRFYNDTNGNCVMDSGEAPLPNQTIYATGSTGFSFYGYTDYNGWYSLKVNSTGLYTIATYSGYNSPCGNITLCGNANNTINVTTLGDTLANNNFGFVSNNGYDLSMHPGWTSANPGFQKRYWIYYGNHSPVPFTGNATIKFVYDSALVYLSSGLSAVHDAIAHSLTWTVNAASSNWGSIGDILFQVPANTPQGYLLNTHFYIGPTANDCDSSDNHLHFTEPVTGSMDPNEKQVSPAGPIWDEDSVLTYTIHFQNTGTDTTWFIILKDTLPEFVRPETVRNLASSHPYSEFNVSGSGILTWVFNPIYLVDSNTNEEASKGFVKFSIKRKKDLPIATVIGNKASIYFDYNQPIVTNTIQNTITDPNYIFEPGADGNGVTVKAFPNPFSEATTVVIDGLNTEFDFRLFDVTGRLANTINAINTNRFELKRGALPAGIYFYQISTSAGKVANGKLIVQ